MVQRNYGHWALELSEWLCPPNFQSVCIMVLPHSMLSVCHVYVSVSSHGMWEKERGILLGSSNWNLRFPSLWEGFSPIIKFWKAYHRQVGQQHCVPLLISYAMPSAVLTAFISSVSFFITMITWAFYYPHFTAKKLRLRVKSYDN